MVEGDGFVGLDDLVTVMDRILAARHCHYRCLPRRHHHCCGGAARVAPAVPAPNGGPTCRHSPPVVAKVAVETGAEGLPHTARRLLHPLSMLPLLRRTQLHGVWPRRHQHEEKRHREGLLPEGMYQAQQRRRGQQGRDLRHRYELGALPAPPAQSQLHSLPMVRGSLRDLQIGETVLIADASAQLPPVRHYLPRHHVRVDAPDHVRNGDPQPSLWASWSMR